MKTIEQKFLERIENVLKYENSKVVTKYSQLHNLPLDTAKNHFSDLKKFLLLCAVSDEPQSPAHMLDEIWHTFVLFTRDYANFCNHYLGTFVHHAPEVITDPLQERQSPKNYIRTRAFASQYFGDFAKELWPDPAFTPVNEICKSSNGCGNGGNCDGTGGYDD